MVGVSLAAVEKAWVMVRAWTRWEVRRGGTPGDLEVRIDVIPVYRDLDQFPFEPVSKVGMPVGV